MNKNYLLTPGPTPVPADVSLAMARPVIHHRTPQYLEIFKEVNDGLKVVFRTTKSDIFTFTSSGTGAMESAVSNLLSPKDKVIVVQGGKFGERWAEICRFYGVEVLPIDVEWGDAVEPFKIEEALKKNPKVKAVYTTLCETSTGVLNDIKTICTIVGATDAVLVVDAISGLGADALLTDEWGVDVVVAGSQKGLMIPPGLSFVCINNKAWQLVEKAALPRFYFCYKSAKKALQSQDTPFTSAVTLMIGLREALRLIQSEGLENVIARHRKMAEATRAAVRALGLELYSKAPSNALTAVVVPAHLDGEKLVKCLRDEFGVTFAGGQAELKGKIFRIAHLGYIERMDIIVAISALEMMLAKMGYKVELGKGVKAAEEVLK